jgi:RND family efflux transporter MFP subunit
MLKRILYCTPRRKKSIISIPKQAILITLFASLSVLAWKAPLLHGEEQLALSGITEPIKDVTLSLSVGGTISRISFREGANVRKGQTILELDNKLEKLEVARRKLIWEGKAEVESAVAQVSTSKSLLEATRELYNSTGSVSKEELDKLDLEHKLAVSEHKRLQIAEERERIEYEMALENLYKRRLRSPISGTIIKLFLEQGESCEPEQPLVQVVDTTRCRLVCNVEEWIGRTLRKGQLVALKIQIGTESVGKKGTVVFVSPVADPASGLLEVKAEFENQDGTVRPGVTGFMLLESP